MNEAFENLRKKLIKQAQLVGKKISPASPKELTNQDMEFMLYAVAQEEYATRHEIKINERLVEDIHQRMTRLDVYQMSLVNYRYYQAKPEEEIAEILHTDRSKIHREIDKLLDILRQ